MGNRRPRKYIMDLEKLTAHNAEGCPACGRKFSLGDTTVMACGAWADGAKLIHENEAVFDERSGTYIERRCFSAGR